MGLRRRRRDSGFSRTEGDKETGKKMGESKVLLLERRGCLGDGWQRSLKAEFISQDTFE